MSQFQKGFIIEPHFSVGDVLSRTISTLLDKPMLFFGLAAIAALPSTVVNSITFTSGFTAFISFFLNLLFGLMIQGAMAYGVFISLAGNDPSWGEVVSRGFRHVLRMFLIVLIFGLLFILLSIVATMFIVFLKSGAFAVITALLMLVVMAIAACAWAVTIPGCVVEQLGPIDSINRSAELTKGYRWRLFGLFVLVFIGAMALVFMVSTIAALVFSNNMQLLPKMEAAAFFLVSVVSTAFGGVMCSVIYYDLRVVKEGLTIDSLADIFD